MLISFLVVEQVSFVFGIVTRENFSLKFRRMATVKKRKLRILFQFFLLFSLVSSITMEVDRQNRFLATGDVNGLVKIWDIDQFSLVAEKSSVDRNFPSSFLFFRSLMFDSLLSCFFRSFGRIYASFRFDNLSRLF